MAPDADKESTVATLRSLGIQMHQAEARFRSMADDLDQIIALVAKD